jgi:hypothetical protein
MTTKPNENVTARWLLFQIHNHFDPADFSVLELTTGLGSTEVHLGDGSRLNIREGVYELLCKGFVWRNGTNFFAVSSRGTEFYREA